MKKEKILKIAGVIIAAVIFPLVIVTGYLIFDENGKTFLILVAAILACVPFFINYERQKDNSRKIVLVATMTALAILGRLIFASVPFFKPVTAIIIITGVYLGGDVGFLSGALAALVSNFFFGQGSWTPFQMFAWGIIGFIAGLLSKLLRNRIAMSVYAGLSGILFSVIMDAYTTLWFGGGSFNLKLFITTASASFPQTVIYVVSNVIFILILGGVIGKKIDRLRIKYNI